MYAYLVDSYLHTIFVTRAFTDVHRRGPAEFRVSSILKTMNISFSLLLVACTVATDAWAPAAPGRSISTVLMASKGAKKWDRKKAWLAKRGFSDEPTPDGVAVATKIPMTIVGSGRIGGLLAEGGKSIVVGREDSIDAEGSGPILVTTRNDALESIVEKCPENRRKDLVFMQNGYLDDFLQAKGLMDNTQVLLFLSVTAKGADPIDGVTKANPEGLTAATGEHAQAFADRLAALDLKCNVITPEEYRPAMFEKLM